MTQLVECGRPIWRVAPDVTVTVALRSCDVFTDNSATTTHIRLQQQRLPNTGRSAADRTKQAATGTRDGHATARSGTQDTRQAVPTHSHGQRQGVSLTDVRSTQRRLYPHHGPLSRPHSAVYRHARPLYNNSNDRRQQADKIDRATHHTCSRQKRHPNVTQTHALTAHQRSGTVPRLPSCASAQHQHWCGLPP